MLTREDIERTKASFLQTRDRFIANVNVMQGAVDAMDALLAAMDQKVSQKVSEVIISPDVLLPTGGPAGGPDGKKELPNGRAKN